MRSIAVIFAGMLFFGCDGEQSSIAASGCESPQSFLAHVLDTVRTYSIFRDSTDWNQIESDAQTAIASAESIDQTYRTVDRLLRQSGDEHAWFRRRDPGGTSADDGPINHQNPTAERIDGKIGYLVVPAAIGRSVDGAREYAKALHSGIRRLNDSGVSDWIIDLRRNWGGSMWPMIAGLGPLLGDGGVGYFVYPGGMRIAWSYDNGAARLGDSTIVDLDSETYEHRGSNSRIALLIGDGTTSSGEAIVVAFNGLPGVKSFGSTTSGMTTAIESKRLCDGSMVGISTAAFADRDGKVYSGELTPDVLIDQASSGDGVLEEARQWLLSGIAGGE